MRPFSLALAALLTLWLGACANSANLDANSGSAPSASTGSELAAAQAGLPVLEGMATVEMVVNGSPITMEIDGTDAPITAGNFVDLVNRGVYDGLVFHRVVRDPQPFVVQGGDPQSKDPNVPAQQLGTGSFIDPDTGAPRYVPLEIKPAGAAEPIYSKTFEEANISAAPELTHKRGAVAMARSQAVDSASAQFYITLAELPFLDGSYAVFGYVTSGMDVVDAIQQGDRIESARVVSGLENLKTP
ncbi:peptidylprolyl isomerase [Nodosilinea nodulosa]|uniref:peptidylprolyl isomerase n=1 Tax=Nodosilinea nodulosa TaxID=416001 RepID=UPI0003630749